jgi:tRNA nucleotidyltransferase/poly(A) polymerase
MFLTDALAHPVFDKLRVVAADMGQRAFVIGGFTRDWLLQRPCKDIDVVVEGKGTDIAERFAKAIGSDDYVLYENFRTAMVRYEDYVVEFVGARKESYSRDSRKPVVEEGTLLDDQLRRDFTINAMGISLNAADYGLLVDPFGGVADLDAGILRTPTDPQITFSDDPLRMMRAIRFSTQLGFTIDETTWEALCANVERIQIVSAERITDELNKIILAPEPSVGFRLLFDSGLLHFVLPELERMQGVEVRNGISHKDNFYHTLQVLDNVARMTDDLWTRWGAILHDIAKPICKRFDPKLGWTFHGHEDRGSRMVPVIFARLRLPQDHKMKTVQALVALHARPIALIDDVTDSAIRRLVVDAGDDLERLLTLCRADITTRDGRKLKRFLENYDLVERKIGEVSERDNLRNFQPPVTGEMIMEMFGIPPSRLVGELKTAVREAILEGDIPNQLEPALELVKRIWAERNK